MKTNKQGISLIVLVITVIVMIILAGAIILSLSNTGIFDRAEEATFKETVRAYETELTLYMMERISNNPTLDMTTVNASKTTTPSIKDMIPSITASDEDVFEVSAGALKYVGEDTNKITWCENIGVATVSAEEIAYNTTYADEIALALEIGEVVDGVYSIKDEYEYRKDTSSPDYVAPSVRGNIAIPYGVTKVNAIDSFAYIEEIIYPNTVTEISACTSLYTLKKITIPEKVTVIPDGWNYASMYMTSIELHDGITYIGEGFLDTTADSLTINYRGTEAQWNAIEINQMNDLWKNKTTIVYNYNG